MNTTDFIEWSQLCIQNSLLYGKIWFNLLNASDSDTENCLLFEKFQTFLKVFGQIAFTSWSQSDIFESIASGSNSKGVNDDILLD